MQLLNKPREILIKRLNAFLNKHSLKVEDEFFERLIHLLQGCADGKYKWQNLYKNSLLPIIERKLPGDLQEFYINHMKFGVGMTKAKMINIYGEERGNLIWDNYCEKQAETNTFEYKNNKYGMSIEDFRAYNKSRSVTLELCIRRHGEVEGKKIWKNYCDTQAIVGTSLSYFQGKYGDVEGKERYLKLNKQKSLNIDTFIRKYGEVEGKERYHEWRKSFSTKANYFVSPISQQLFEEIESNLSFVVDSMYAYKNKEFGIYSRENDRAYLFDYVIPSLKLCIEFNGDLYHANPKIYAADQELGYPYYGKIAKDIWERDRFKNSIIESQGYMVVTVWEYDCKNDKDATVLRCVEIINEIHDRKMQSGIVGGAGN